MLPERLSRETRNKVYKLVKAAIKHLTEMSELETVYGQLARNLRIVLSALRARSSAPEAREKALGNLLAVIHRDGGHRALEVGTKQAALEAEKIVAGLMAAPSADKLRIAVEAFMPSAEVAFLWSKEAPPAEEVQRYRERYWVVREALAALKWRAA